MPPWPLPRALAFSSAGLQGAVIAGPAIGGLLYTAGPATTYGSCAVLFAAAGALCLALRYAHQPPRAEPTTWTSLLAGVHFVWNHKVVLGAISRHERCRTAHRVQGSAGDREREGRARRAADDVVRRPRRRGAGRPTRDATSAQRCSGRFNLSRFHLPAMDVLYDRLQALPDGPERLQVFDQAKRLAVAYMPEKTLVHRVSSQLMQPWLVGYRAPLFGNKWFHLVDLDMVALRAQCRGGRASSCRGGSSIADV